VVCHGHHGGLPHRGRCAAHSGWYGPEFIAGQRTDTLTSICVHAGKFKRRGVVTPVTKDIYQPVLEELKEEGITFHERSSEDHEA